MKNQNAQNSLKCKIYIEIFFTFRCPNFRGGGEGVRRLGQNPNFSHFFFEGSPYGYGDDESSLMMLEIIIFNMLIVTIFFYW